MRIVSAGVIDKRSKNLVSESVNYNIYLFDQVAVHT